MQDQARRSVENLHLALKTAGLDLKSIVNLMIYLPQYSDARLVTEVLDETFEQSFEAYPATTLVGVTGLEGGCRVKMDAIATSSHGEGFRLADLPLAQGNRCHGVRVGNFVFLSGVDAADGQGNVISPLTIQSQTAEVLTRINKILDALEDMVKTMVYLVGGQDRSNFAEAYRSFFKRQNLSAKMPAGLMVEVRELSPGCLVEIDAVADLSR